VTVMILTKLQSNITLYDKSKAHGELIHTIPMLSNVCHHVVTGVTQHIMLPVHGM